MISDFLTEDDVNSDFKGRMTWFQILKVGWHKFRSLKGGWHEFRILKAGWHEFIILKVEWHKFRFLKGGCTLTFKVIWIEIDIFGTKE